MDQIAFYQAKLAWETDSWDVFEALQRGDPLTLVDGRSAEAYARETLPGAINLPHRTISAASTAHLPKDRLLVAFCDGIGCNSSTRTALKLAQLGFQVKELQGGIDWWKRDGYATTAQAGQPIVCGCEG
ncbi:rhodanese-like domain-containing protein [Paludibacterium purpuratum]|uniref:Rhodanese-related sulfurtransferase n=1 Tax=Paludibacterium purpuratum TaxID=1144873 RepID=A0A4R7B7G5_9NEIS|nr:rhodanese-like domain-containing protein [Paludibacterium purpuratum]TDR80700.1 rhodanese-related sulfurtransferase [Paludibacterium purpuratum]